MTVVPGTADSDPLRARTNRVHRPAASALGLVLGTADVALRIPLRGQSGDRHSCDGTQLAG